MQILEVHRFDEPTGRSIVTVLRTRIRIPSRIGAQITPLVVRSARRACVSAEPVSEAFVTESAARGELRLQVAGHEVGGVGLSGSVRIIAC